MGYLRSVLDRAQERRQYAAWLLERARGELHPNDPLHARSLRKIEGDLIAAERDVG
jgi:hypothetical protein